MGSVENVAKGPVSAMQSFSFIQGLPPITCEALRMGGHERDIFNRAVRMKIELQFCGVSEMAI
jgi:hypothetical protein